MKNNIREILDETNINIVDELNILEYIDELEKIKEDSLDKLDELENKIYKAIEYIKSDGGIKLFNSISSRQQWYNYLLSILEGKEVEDE